VDISRRLLELGVHKQWSNRWTEIVQTHEAILTGTEESFANMYAQRSHPDAQPEIRRLSDMMQEAQAASTPQLLHDGEWHLPLIYEEDRIAAAEQYPDNTELALMQISAGRCARVSYLTHDGRRDLSADVKLHDMLVGAGHMSPLEHMARPFSPDEWEDVVLMQELLRARATARGDNPVLVQARLRQTEYLGNLRGWVQYRKLVPGESNYAEAVRLAEEGQHA
jgi:thymidylate synthase ThyX